MRWLSLLAMSLLVAPASAGTEEDPEIEDPAGDASPPTSASPGAQEALDLVAWWIEEGDGTLVVAWKVVALAPSGQQERFEYGVDLEGDGVVHHVEAWRQYGDAVQNGGWWSSVGPSCAHTSGVGGAMPATLSFDEDVVRLEVPAQCLEEAGTWTPLGAYTFHCVMRPGNVCVSESTPDETGQGRDFQRAAPDAGPPGNTTAAPASSVGAPAASPVLVFVAFLARRAIR